MQLSRISYQTDEEDIPTQPDRFFPPGNDLNTPRSAKGGIFSANLKIQLCYLL